jgi:aminoglycoside 6'-N-acetyltransferase
MVTCGADLMPGVPVLRAMREDDLELVRAWLSEPHVARWYLAGSSIEHQVEELRQCVAGEQPTRALVVLERGRPIGWCQWYLCRDYPDHAAGIAAGPDDVGLDYAIGDPARTGQGVGTALIATLVAHIRREHPMAPLVADPEAANVASRRALEKNGFELQWEGPVGSEPTDEVMAIYRLPASDSEA